MAGTGGRRDMLSAELQPTQLEWPYRSAQSFIERGRWGEVDEVNEDKNR